MRDDPIVEEVRKVREALAAKFSFDVDAIFADLQQRQTALGVRLVTHKRPSQTSTETTTQATALSSSP